MKAVKTASGAKYEVAGDPTTSFWNRGRNGTLVVAGKTFPECRPMAGTAPPSFTATGNEPGWRLDITDGRLTLVTDNGRTTTTVATPKAETVSGGCRYSGSGDGRTMSVTVLDAKCADSMTGMPRPNIVEVIVNGANLKGCGGDPASRLQGEPWIVQTIDGASVAAGPRVTMSFGRDGRVSGNALCNAYTGEYTLTGEGLTIGKVIATLKACLPEIDKQESAFLSTLRGVQRFEMRPDGTLVLHAADKRSITATRENPAQSDPALTGTGWRLVSASVAAPTLDDQSRIILKFTAARMSADSGCNTSTGMYRVEGSTLVIEQMASTRKACVGTAQA